MWHRFNPNPDGITTGDCTVRAICAATGMDWISAHTALCELSRDMSDMPSSNRVWWAFLRALGFEQILLPECPDCITVAEFAAMMPRDTFVLGPHEHAVTVIDGDWWDAWDSGETIPLYYFRRVKDDGVESLYAVSDNVSAADDAADDPG